VGATVTAARGRRRTGGARAAERCRRAQAETYRWARCREAAPLPRLRRVGLPLPEALLDVLAPALAWEDLQARPRAWLRCTILSGVELGVPARAPTWAALQARPHGRQRGAALLGSRLARLDGRPDLRTPCLPPLLLLAAVSDSTVRGGACALQAHSSVCHDDVRMESVCAA